MRREALRWWVGLTLSAACALARPAVADDGKPPEEVVPAEVGTAAAEAPPAVEVAPAVIVSPPASMGQAPSDPAPPQPVEAVPSIDVAPVVLPDAVVEGSTPAAVEVTPPADTERLLRSIDVAPSAVAPLETPPNGAVPPDALGHLQDHCVAVAFQFHA